jgi:alkyldihydroxyacetonephosphate synthase
VVGEALTGVCAVVCCEGEPGSVAVEGARLRELTRDAGATELDPSLAERWWDRRYEFYGPPHHPELPAIWGTIDVVATYARIAGVHAALQEAVARRYAHVGLQLRMHYSHWYRWGTMIYARFLVPDGPGGEEALTLHDRIWEDAIGAVLAAGGVISHHHGIGLKLAPYMQAQQGPALETLRAIKSAIDPQGIMNPGKLGL